MARSYRSLREALESGRGIERPFNCPVHPDAHASASVNVLKGVWHCLAPTTRVLTADLRHVRIEHLEIGDQLAGFTEEPVEFGRHKRRVWAQSTVLAWKRIEQPGHLITLGDGTKIRASSGHSWLVRTKKGVQWMRTDQLLNRNGNFPSLIQLTDVWETSYSYAAGYVAAALDGEGYYQCSGTESGVRKHVTLGFYQRDNEMASEMVNRLAELRIGFHEYPYFNSVNSPLTSNGSLRMLKITRKHNVLRTLGMTRPPRLLAKFRVGDLGQLTPMAYVPIVSVEPIGDIDVIALKTSTATFVAEGFASHNCYSCHASGKTADGTHDLNYIPLLRDARIPEMPVAAVHLTNAYLGYSPYWAARYGVQVATWFNTGTDPVTGMPTIPITDRLGTTLHGFLLRNGAAAPDEPKYRYPVGVPVSRLLFGHHLVPARCELLMLVEGASDVLGLYRWLLPPDVAVVAVFGAGLHAAQAVMVRDLAPHRVVVAMDADDPGRKANQRSADHLDDLGVRATIHDWSIHDVSDPGSLQENPWPMIVST